MSIISKFKSIFLAPEPTSSSVITPAIVKQSALRTTPAYKDSAEAKAAKTQSTSRAGVSTIELKLTTSPTEMVFDPENFDVKRELGHSKVQRSDPFSDTQESLAIDEDDFFDPSYLEQIDNEVLRLIDAKFARQELVIPINLNGDLVTILYADKYSLPQVEYLLKSKKLRVKSVASTPDLIQQAIEKHYPQLSDEEAAEHYDKLSYHMGQIQVDDDDDRHFISKGREIVESDTAIRSLVNSILCDSVKKGATDLNIDLKKIRVESGKFEYRLIANIRVDNECRLLTQRKMSKKLFPRFVRIVKAYADVDVKNDRDGQTGVIRPTVDLDITEADVELRANFIPTGDESSESISIRIQHKHSFIYALDKIGLLPFQLDLIKEEIMALTEGMLLFTGPIGHGKNTSMISFLKEYFWLFPHKRIVTAEDGIEIYLENATQINAQSFEDDSKRAGRGIKYYLSHILRHNPDVIMIGEVREPETAAMAIESAGLGHLLLTTMHTANTLLSIIRLRNLKIENYQIADTVKAVFAQRLVKQICEECDLIEDTSVTKIPRLQEYIQKIDWNQPARFVKGSGKKRGRTCQNCNGSGYRGRMGIFEILPLSYELRTLISEHATTDQLRAQALTEGLRTLFSCGLEHALRGNTTLGEVIACIGKPSPMMEGLGKK